MIMDIKELDKQYIMNTYKRFDLHIVEGKDAVCFDEKGKKYYDLTSGIGVNSLGYCNEDWCKAVCEQVVKLNHTSNLYYTSPCVQLAKKLCDKTGAKNVFFANSGAEANEGAIKTARKYSFDKYGEGRNTIITLVNSFHGRTVTTLSATGQDVFHNYFYPFTQGFKYVEAGNIEQLEKAIDKSVCAVMLEFVQGEGGVIAMDKDYIKKVRDLCDKNDVLMIADEVQTGVGRTGYFLASQGYSVKPDITTLAKGLGGGLPIGAVLCYDKVQNVMGISSHGSTFGGNPIVCAGAIAVVDKLDEQFLKEVKEKGDLIKDFFKSCDEVESVSGMGMMVGIALKTKKAGEVVSNAIKKGVLALTAKDKIRLLPPLNIDKNTLLTALELLKTVICE